MISYRCQREAQQAARCPSCIRPSASLRDRQCMAAWHARKRTRDALLKQITETLKRGDELAKRGGASPTQ
jgi:hypothetical protein